MKIDDLTLHIKTFHEVKSDIKCNLCNATFSKKVSLKKHIEKVHQQRKTFEVPPLFALGLSPIEKVQQENEILKKRLKIYKLKRNSKVTMAEIALKLKRKYGFKSKRFQEFDMLPEIVKCLQLRNFNTISIFFYLVTYRHILVHCIK